MILPTGRQAFNEMIDLNELNDPNDFMTRDKYEETSEGRGKAKDEGDRSQLKT